MVDKLDEEIAKARKEAEDLRRRADAKELELRALLKAAQLRPLSSPLNDMLSADFQKKLAEPVSRQFPFLSEAEWKRIWDSSPLPMTQVLTELQFTDADKDVPRRSGGRQEGSISNKWRAVLAGMYARNDFHTAEEIVMLASLNGVELQESSAHARMRRYAELEYIDESEDGRYRVTQFAAERFGLKSSEPKQAP